VDSQRRHWSPQFGVMARWQGVGRRVLERGVLRARVGQDHPESALKAERRRGGACDGRWRCWRINVCCCTRSEPNQGMFHEYQQL
jgi:hypothetical protein